MLPCHFVQMSCHGKSRKMLKGRQGVGRCRVQISGHPGRSYASVLPGQNLQHALHHKQMRVIVPRTNDFSWLEHDFQHLCSGLAHVGRLIGKHHRIPGCLIRHAGCGKPVFSLEPGHRCHGFRAINSVRNQGQIVCVKLSQHPQHGLQAADGLPEKGFRGSHRTTSCRTGSRLPMERLFPGNWVMVVDCAYRPRSWVFPITAEVYGNSSGERKLVFSMPEN